MTGTLAMPVLPIPMIIALGLLGFFVLRLLQRDTHATLLALIAVCAAQSALSALIQYYGFAAIRPLQPVLAMVIPPLAWFAFSRAAGSTKAASRWWWHGFGPSLAVVSFAVNPLLLDLLIPMSFSAYGLAIILALWRGEDSLINSRLDSGSTALFGWRIVAFSLLASACCDIMIAVALVYGFIGALMWLPSIMSSLSLLGLGALAMTSALQTRQADDEEVEAKVSEEDAARDQAFITRLDALMAEHKLFLDPDLTLARLSRRMQVPAKQLSAAINRTMQENVSRYVNRRRIEHAAGLLAKGTSVTSAIYDSGFNTKSNFNREFLRVKGQSPSDWLHKNFVQPT